MIILRVFAAAVGGVLFAAAGVAAAGNFASDRQVDFFAKGTHQFYVWCGSGGDYVATIEWYRYQKELGGAGPNVIPPKYVSAKTSPVKVSVVGGPAQIAPIIIK